MIYLWVVCWVQFSKILWVFTILKCWVFWTMLPKTGSILTNLKNFKMLTGKTLQSYSRISHASSYFNESLSPNSLKLLNFSLFNKKLRETQLRLWFEMRGKLKMLIKAINVWFVLNLWLLSAKWSPFPCLDVMFKEMLWWKTTIFYWKHKTWGKTWTLYKICAGC